MPETQHQPEGDHLVEDGLAAYEACLLACTNETELRTVWALPYIEAGYPVPEIPEDLVDLWR